MKKILNKTDNPIIKEGAAIALLFICTLIYFQNLIFNKKLFFANDMYSFFYTQRFYAKKVLLNGFFPFWNTDIFCGAPYIDDIQNALFYPFTWLFYFLSPYAAITVTLTTHIFLAGTFTYILLRRFFLVSQAGSFLGALVYMFSGFFTMQMVHLNQILACAWSPLILYCYLTSLEKKTICSIIFSGTILALSLLTGGSQNSFYLGILLFLVSVYTGITRYKSTKEVSQFFSPLLILFASVMLALLLSAIQIFPTVTLTDLSLRSGGISFLEASADSLLMIQFFITIVLPNYFGYFGDLPYWGARYPEEMASYIGVLPFVFSFYALIKSKKKYISFLFFTAIFFLLLAFGSQTPLYSIFFPFGFNRFRAPARIIYLFILLFSILSGIGADLLLHDFSPANKERVNKAKVKSNKISLILLLVLILVSFIIYYLTHYPLNPFFEKGLKISDFKKLWYNDAFITLTSILSLFFLFNYNVPVRIKKILTLLVIGISLIHFISQSAFHNETLPSDFDPVRYRDSTISPLITDNSLFRIYSLDAYNLSPNAGIIYNLSDIEGYGGGILPLKRNHDFMDKVRQWKNNKMNINYRLLDMLNVKYIISKQTIYAPGYRPRGEQLYENTNPTPRAFIVHNVQIVPIDTDILTVIGNKDFNPKKKIILEKSPVYAKPKNMTNSEGYVHISKYTPNAIEIDAGLTKKGILHLSDTYYPGWKVFVNNKPARLLRANYSFRAVALQKGTHTIRFVYQPQSFYLGLYITLFTTILCIAIVVSKKKNLRARTKIISHFNA